MSILVKENVQKATCLICTSICISAVLAAWYIAIYGKSCIQGFFIGLAILMVSLAIYLLFHRRKDEMSKKESAVQTMMVFIFNIAFDFLLPFVALLPFFGRFGSNVMNSAETNFIFEIEWLYYALIFSAATTVVFVIYACIKHLKNRAKRNAP